MKQDTEQVRNMKIMIAEFAIHANTIFANELDINNLFLRKLETFNKNYDNIHDLIKDGISAKYTTENKQHNLIGTNNIYTHSTSPLRRASDCIVHFLLKAKHLNIEPPFNQTQLELYAEHLNKKTKESKNIQFKDIKLRTFQWIAEELECRLNCIKMKVKIIDIREPYINLMIIKLDDVDVNIPYTIRKKPNTNNININNIFNINITKIKPYKKFDEGTLPELDNIINPKP
jgi:exoribonuclease II